MRRPECGPVHLKINGCAGLHAGLCIWANPKKNSTSVLYEEKKLQQQVHIQAPEILFTMHIYALSCAWSLNQWLKRERLLGSTSENNSQILTSPLGSRFRKSTLLASRSRFQNFLLLASRSRFEIIFSEVKTGSQEKMHLRKIEFLTYLEFTRVKLFQFSVSILRKSYRIFCFLMFFPENGKFWN